MGEGEGCIAVWPHIPFPRCLVTRNLVISVLIIAAIMWEEKRKLLKFYNKEEFYGLLSTLLTFMTRVARRRIIRFFSVHKFLCDDHYNCYGYPGHKCIIGAASYSMYVNFLTVIQDCWIFQKNSHWRPNKYIQVPLPCLTHTHTHTEILFLRYAVSNLFIQLLKH